MRDYGGIEFGFALDEKEVIINTSREGARAQGASGSYRMVEVEYPSSFSVLPQFMQGLSNNITLSVETVMQLE